MLRTLLKSKIHRAIVTGSNIDYIGSLTIDSYLMELADIKEYEQIHVLNITNGERLTTYAISGQKNSGIICANGAASHKIKAGDLIIIVAYGQLDEKEIKDFKPKIVLVDKNNKPTDNVIARSPHASLGVNSATKQSHIVMHKEIASSGLCPSSQ